MVASPNFSVRIRSKAAALSVISQLVDNYYHWQLLPLTTTTTGNYWCALFWQFELEEDQPGAVEHAWGSQGGQEGGGTYLIRHSLPNY